MKNTKIWLPASTLMSVAIACTNQAPSASTESGSVRPTAESALPSTLLTSRYRRGFVIGSNGLITTLEGAATDDPKNGAPTNQDPTNQDPTNQEPTTEDPTSEDSTAPNGDPTAYGAVTSETACELQADGTTDCPSDDGVWSCTNLFNASADLIEVHCTGADGAIDCVSDTSSMTCRYDVDGMDPCVERYALNAYFGILESTCDFDGNGTPDCQDGDGSLTCSYEDPSGACSYEFDRTGAIASVACTQAEDPASCPDPSDPKVHYVFGPGPDRDSCLVVLFECDVGQDLFSNECGCGCIAHP